MNLVSCLLLTIVLTYQDASRISAAIIDPSHPSFVLEQDANEPLRTVSLVSKPFHPSYPIMGDIRTDAEFLLETYVRWLRYRNNPLAFHPPVSGLHRQHSDDYMVTYIFPTAIAYPVIQTGFNVFHQVLPDIYIDVFTRIGALKTYHKGWLDPGDYGHGQYTAGYVFRIGDDCTRLVDGGPIQGAAPLPEQRCFRVIVYPLLHPARRTKSARNGLLPESPRVV